MFDLGAQDSCLAVVLRVCDVFCGPAWSCYMSNLGNGVVS